MYKKIIKNSGLTLIALFFIGITQLIFNIVIARFFNPDILGEINIAISTTILFSVIVSSGLNPANNKYVAEYLGRKEGKIKVKKIFSFSLFTSITLSIIITLLLIIFKNQIIKQFDLSSNYYVISLPIVIIYPLYLILKGMFYGISDIGYYIKIELISRVAFFIGLIIIVITKSYIILPFIILYTLFPLLSFLKLKKYIIFNFKDKVIKRVISYSIISFTGTFSSLARTRLSIIIPAIFLAKDEIGLFSAAFSLLTLFYFIPRAITLVMTPMISFNHGKNNEKDILRTLNFSNKYLTIYTIIFSALMIIVSKFILISLFGKEYLLATTTLQIISISALFTVIAIPSVNTLSATKYVHIPNIAGVLGLVFSLASWFILIPMYGITGIALGFLIGTIINSIIPIYYANKYFKPRSTLKIILKGILSFAIAFIFIKIPTLSAAIFLIINLFLNKDDLINFVKRIKHETRN